MAKAQEGEVYVTEVNKGRMTFYILGTAPLICNRMSEKGGRELLMPKGKKNAAEKASSLKHDPLAEYRASPYTSRGDGGPTRIQLLASMFKGAMMTAALDLPGTNKSQIGRLIHVENDRVDLYGEPMLFMAITRSADIKRTPDVRTRAIIPQWGCKVTVNFVKPLIREQSVANLIAAAGITAGIGDYRVEKGKGNYGSFKVVSADDPDLKEVMKMGRVVQDKALANPECYDDETESLLSWYRAEFNRRGFKVAA